MPKRVNHEDRKIEILQIFLKCAANEGLHSVTLRKVAAQAGISLRQIQYYFGTKDALVQGGLYILEQKSHKNFNRRLSKISDCSSVETLKTLFDTALPTDAESQQFHLLWMSYALHSLTNPLLSDSPLMAGTNRLQHQITEIIASGVSSGELRNDLNVENEAVIILSLINGLGTAVLLGQQTVKAAMSAFSNQLNRLR